MLHDVGFSVALTLAFILGLAARQVGLPPLVGFLAAGFALRGLGFEPDPTIEAIGELGVLLLLFTIGLKLRVSDLAVPAVWAGSALHLLLSMALFGIVLAVAGLGVATVLLVAFGLSFSSTVFAVKTFEDKREVGASFAKIAIGILIMQDLFAVVFITLSAGELPSPWALALLGLVGLRPLLGMLLNRSGHGELLPLFGLFAAVGLGVTLFDLAGLKPDLGALVLGVLLATHPRAGDVAHQLFSFKEILLVGFFLSIGLSGVPTLPQLWLAILLLLALPLKFVAFFWLLCRLGLGARTAFRTALSLATYSEFGLIVVGVAVEAGWLAEPVLVVLAVAVALSFVVAAPLSAWSVQIFDRIKPYLRRFERSAGRESESLADAGPTQVVVLGMGRVGTSAYDRLRMDLGDVVIGVDADADAIAAHRRAGRRVLLGDATDSEWWESLHSLAIVRRERGMAQIRAFALALPAHESNLFVLSSLRRITFDGLVVAVAHYEEHAASLKDAGASYAFEIYAEAGVGLASHVRERLDAT